MSMFKYYLHHILHEGSPDHGELSEDSSEDSPDHGELPEDSLEDSPEDAYNHFEDPPYHPICCLKNRALIGEVLMQAEKLGPSSTYIPLFCKTESALLQVHRACSGGSKCFNIHACTLVLNHSEHRSAH